MAISPIPAFEGWWTEAIRVSSVCSASASETKLSMRACMSSANGLSSGNERKSLAAEPPRTQLEYAKSRSPPRLVVGGRLCRYHARIAARRFDDWVLQFPRGIVYDGSRRR